jgi:hypothetical protein
MNEDPDLIENLIQRVRELILTYIELIKLKAVDRISAVISSLLPDIIVSLLVFIFLAFLNLALALWLGELLGKIYFGFLAVGGFYFILGMISHFFLRGWLKKVTTTYIIKQFFR